ncbi:hypothetical protein [Ferroplasma sp.]|uniref:DUF4870 domain-containing protein n=1 Tax=Ferroplasma sp. TaxID=2591003 RepID=UPI00307D5A45
MENKENNVMFLVAYLIPIITGVVVYFMYANTDKKLKFQSVQAILLGIAFLILGIIFNIISNVVITTSAATLNLYLAISGVFYLLLTLLWIYGMYTGYKASKGQDADIPVLADYARSLSGEK